VALGRAIVREPAVFLMDEPLSNLDAKLRVQMRTEIAKLHNRLKTTVIYVTHDQTEAMTMGDRIVVMKDGLVQQVAPPQELYDRPANVFVAGFIGSPAMNFLRLGLSEEAGGAYAVGDGVRVRIPASRSSRLKGQNGRQIILGVRPEDVECDSAYVEHHSDSVINAQVEVVEPLGAEVFLYVSCGSGNITARVEPGTKARVGDRIPVALNMDNVHLFDVETEMAMI
jgi:multiple sugar transport system ATP-binding protein